MLAKRITTVPTSKVVLVKGRDIPTIADRGTSADIVSLEVAQQLELEGVIEGIYEPSANIAIQFGIESATVPVMGVIYGRGLLGTVYVVNDSLATVLISDITFTEKGIILVEDNIHLIGIAGGEIIFVGSRDPTVARTDSKAMWRLDIRSLLLQEDPRIRMEMEESQKDQTAWDVIELLGIRPGVAQGGVQHQCYGAKPTFTVRDVRMGRAIVKALGVSAFTLANSVERNALKNIPIFLTAALLRAIGNARGNIASAITTARKKSLGGTGIRSTKPGECVSFDLEGKHPRSTWGCCYGGGFWDENTRWPDGYGLISKSDIDLALVKYCQKVEMYGKGPVRQARFDAGAEVSKNGQLTEAFRAACAKYNIYLCPSAPEDQATNPIERGWQTISHRMTTMLLQQDTLTKSDWLLVWLAALVLDSVVCHAGEQRSPYELMTGNVPDIAHAAAFFVGQTVMFPNTGRKELMKPNYQVGVHIAPVLGNKAHLVLVGGSRTPQVRSRVEAVGLELKNLSSGELEKLKPTFDETGDLVEFHSRVNVPFSMSRYMKDYDDGVDLEDPGETLSEMVQLEVDRWMGPVQREQTQLAGTKKASKARAGVKPTLEMMEAVIEDDQEVGVGTSAEGLPETEEVPTTHEADMALLVIALQAVVEELSLEHGEGDSHGGIHRAFMAREGVKRSPEDLAREVLGVYKARTSHTKENPTQGMLERDPVLAEVWKESTRKEISGGILEGFRVLLTDEEKENQGWKALPLVMVYSVKRDGTLKCRAASNGSLEDPTWFDQDDLFAEGLPPVITRLMTAFAAYHKMVDISADVVQCFAQLNTWDKSKYPRLLCHKLTAYQSPTGQEAWMGNLTNNNGSRDASGQWRMVSKDALVRVCGMTQSKICRQVFFKLQGDDGLLLVGQLTDDLKAVHTDNADGYDMKQRLFEVLEKELGWKMTHQEPTKDYGSLTHTFAVIDGKQAVTLTQEAHIVKVAQLIYGPQLEDMPEVYLPLPKTWSTMASASCTELVDQKRFMQKVMSAAWAGQTRFESSAVALLACMVQRPTVLDDAAINHYSAYLYGSKGVGVTYYEAPVGTHIRTTVPLQLFTDAGENQHLNGAGHWGIAVFLGPAEENYSGAVLAVSQKSKGVVGESVPVNEIMGTAAGVKAVVVLKYLLEEWSGATQEDLETTEMVLEGSAAPVECGVSDAVVQSIRNTVGGHLGDAAMIAAARALSDRPPVSVFGDNQGVVDNISHIRHNSTGLRRVTRVVSFLQGLVEEEVINMFKVAAVDQRADALSKQYTSPVRSAAALEVLLGRHPTVSEYVARVNNKCNKRGSRREDSADGEEQQTEDVLGVFTAHEQVPEQMEIAIQRMCDAVPFLSSSSGTAAKIMAKMGYTGQGGLGLNGEGGEAPLILTRKVSRNGIGCHGSGKVNQGGAFIPSQGGVHGVYIAGAVEMGVEPGEPEEVWLSQRIRKALLKLIPDERGLFRLRLAPGPFDDLLEQGTGEHDGEDVFIAERMRRALIKLTKEERWLFSVELRGLPFTDRMIAEHDVIGSQIPGVSSSQLPSQHRTKTRGSKGSKWKKRNNR